MSDGRVGCQILGCTSMAAGYATLGERPETTEVYIGVPPGGGHMPLCSRHLDLATKKPRLVTRALRFRIAIG